MWSVPLQDQTTPKSIGYLSITFTAILQDFAERGIEPNRDRADKDKWMRQRGGRLLRYRASSPNCRCDSPAS